MAERRVKVVFSAEIQNWKQAMAAAETAMQKAKDAADAAGKASDQAAEDIQKQALAHHAAAKAAGLQYDNTGQLVTMNGKALSSQQAATHGLQTFSAEAYLAGRAAVAAGEDAEAAAKAAAEAEKKATAALEKRRDAQEKVGTVAATAGALTLAGVGLAVKSYADFDKQMSSVDAATHETAENMQLLRDAAVDAGADTAFSAVEAAQGIEEMAKAGVSTADILGGGLKGTLALAAAGALGVGEASEIASSAMTQFGLKGKDIPHIADLLAAAAGKAQGSVQDMGLALSYAGVPAAGLGISIEQTTGTLALFAKSGIVGEKAGTALRAMLVSMVKPAETTKKTMDELGISFSDSEGKFIGLDGAAAVLTDKLGGLDDMTRNATLAQIFGNEALGAAQTLYKGGAQGVQDMTDAVNDYGYASDTANRMQNNLAGDLEKLGGSFDTVLIQSGSGANDVLRGMVQRLEGVVDSVGKVPAPVLGAATGLAALAGGAALVGGGLITIIPKIRDTKEALEVLAPAGSKANSVLSRTERVAKGAALGLSAVAAASAIAGPALDNILKPTGETGDALEKFGGQAAQGAVGADTLNKSFQDLVQHKDGVGDFQTAIEGIADPGIWGNIDNVLVGGIRILSLGMVDATSTSEKARERFKQMGEQLATLDPKKAAQSFQSMAKQTDGSGESLKRLLDYMPAYRKTLEEQAKANGKATDDQTLLDIAMGKIPVSADAAGDAIKAASEKTERAAANAEQLAKDLDEVGLSADGSVVNISKFAAALFSAGLLSLSASDASIAYQDAIDKVTASVVANGRTLDINTEAGRANQSTYNGLARSAMTLAEATATETLATQGSSAAQAELQKNLDQSYKDLVTAAGQFGIVGDEADTMARKALGIPKEIPIETWVNDKATATLDGVKAKADALDGRTVSMGVVTEFQNFIQDIKRPTIEDLNGDTFRPGNSLRVPGLTQETGGRMPGYEDGGRLPSSGPGTDRTDGFLGISSAGIPMARVDAGEWIVNRRSSGRYDRELAAINAGTFPKLPGYANGHAPSREYSARELGFAPSGVSAAASGPIAMTGTLVMDSGEVLGVFRGVANHEANSVIDSRSRASGRQRGNR